MSTGAAAAQASELAAAIHSARSNDNDFNYRHDPAWVEQPLNDHGASLVSAVIATIRGVAP